MDVATIDVSGLIERMTQSGKQVGPFSGTHYGERIGENKIEAWVGSDVLVVGYPKTYYDRTHLFPVVKAGVIASRWGVGFEGQQYFLIDAKLFPGSSGSVVITKPKDIVVIEGQIFVTSPPQIGLLGVFSGAPIVERQEERIGGMTIMHEETLDLGIVWYVEEIERTRVSGIQLRDIANSDKK